MRRKSLPPAPGDLETLRAAHDALPLVPNPELDCCARLQGRLDLPGRDEASTWLDFLRGMGLVAEGPSGFSRVRGDPDASALADAFLAGVLGAREALDALADADGPLDAASVARRTESLVTPWERHRRGGEWPAVWEARTADLLGWLALLDLAERADGGYRASPPD